jgi:Zn ribbon nucleic-acid-binding protein
VESALRHCGFLGEPLAPGRYHVGERFFEHVTFAGCSPHLVLDPPSAGDWRFTHLRLHQPEPPGLRIAPQRSRPRCPQCRAAHPQWKVQLPAWREDATQGVTCPACGHRCAVAELDWRHYGVAARLLVEVCRVWPGEAMPGDRLLSTLAEETEREWDYAWAESLDSRFRGNDEERGQR